MFPLRQLNCVIIPHSGSISNRSSGMLQKAECTECTEEPEDEDEDETLPCLGEFVIIYGNDTRPCG
jgi:hypothetical protein